MSQLECQVCMAETVDVLLCNHCTRELEQAIAELPALLTELDVTITRQDRGTGAALYAMRRAYLQIPGVHYEEGETTLIATPWPFAWDAANILWSAVNTVTTWARHIAESRGVQIPGDADAFLLSNLEAVRQDEAAGQIHDELTSVRLVIMQVVDKQVPDVFAGRCDAVEFTFEQIDDGTLAPVAAACGASLYGIEGEAEVKCPACGMVYKLDERLAEMHGNQINEQLARVHTIANALTTIDAPLPPEKLRKWVQRDALAEPSPEGPACKECRHPTCKLIRRPLILCQGFETDESGRRHALYRVGDVRARVAVVQAQKQGRASG